MSSVSKQTFYARPTIRRLPPAEKLRRWQQHLSNSQALDKSRVLPSKRRRNGRVIDRNPEDDCARDYAASLIDPFNTPPCCVPTWPSFDTRKTKVYVRATSVIGTAGVGFIYAGFTPASDVATCWFTTAAFTGSALVKTGTGVSLGNNNSDYVAADFTGTAAGPSFRLVSMGIRVRYIGTELNMSGIVVALEQPDHADLTGATIGTLQGYIQGSAQPADRRWHQVCIVPRNPSELDFNVSSVVTPASLAIMFTGVAGQSFEFELFQNMELVGAIVRGKTPSYVNTQLFGRVVNRITHLAQTGLRYISNAPDMAARLALTYVRDRYLPGFRLPPLQIENQASEMKIELLN